jgi:VCBS repeat-containing protein
VLVKNPTNGTLVVNAGKYTYTPKANFNGTDTFTYYDWDGAANSVPTTVTITVTPVNDAPVANPDTATTKEDTPVVIKVKANDTDVDGDALTAVSVVTDPTKGGTVTANADGSFTYAPAANFNGTDTFTYRVSDGTLSSAPATVTVNVTAVNDAPVANPDTATTAVNTPVVIDVKANDTDVENNTLSTVLVAGPTNGTVVASAGKYTYTPKANFTGTDTFTYYDWDGAANSVPTTVTITVAAVHNAPVAGNDSATTAEDTPVTVNVLANDTGSGTLTTSVVTGPAKGAVVHNVDGSFTYTPVADFTGTDTFTYYVSDGAATSGPATVTIAITAVNDAPVANPNRAIIEENTSVVLNVKANDTDVDGRALTSTMVTGPAHGTVAHNVDGSFTYTPVADFTGTDTFTYRVSDGILDSAPTPVTITVTSAINDPDLSPAMIRFHEALTASNSSPVLIVTAGSSTTAGQYLVPAVRWPNRLAADLQSAYPLDGGAPSPATRSFASTPPTAPTSNGVQVINVANGGENSGTYLTLSGTARNATTVGNLDPVLVIHQPESADFQNQVNPATTEANIKARIAAIDAASTVPPIHVLVFSYGAWNNTASSYTEQDYVNVLYDIAAQDPDRIMVIDLRTDFAAVGIGYSSDRSDPLHMMYDGNVHLNAAGNAYLEDLILAKMGFSTIAAASVADDVTDPSPM